MLSFRSKPVMIGLVLGVVFAGTILLVTSIMPEPSALARAMLSDCQGTIREVVIHYDPPAGPFSLPVYRDFLAGLPPEVMVWVVCPSPADFDEFCQRVGPVRCRLKPVVVDHPITTWARDRWLAFRPSVSGNTIELLRPREEMGSKSWPKRKGDEKIADDLAALIPGVSAERSSLLFDGGDFVADRQTVFITPRVAERNIQHTVEDITELRRRLEGLFSQRVVLLDAAPPHHAGMFMMAVGDKTMLVADPAAGRKVMADIELTDSLLPGGLDTSAKLQGLCDAVAKQCSREGYRVVRMPVLASTDGRTYMTPLNAILDQQASQRVVYMPIYKGANPLNQAARKIWETVGYQVHPVDCSSVYRYFGSLRCLVSILQRR